MPKMNKLLLVFFMMMTMQSFVVFGQQKRFETGMEAGPNIVYMGSSPDDKTWLSFVGGVHLQYNFSRYFSIRTNFFYERKGEKRDSSAFASINLNNAIIETYQKYDYLTAPLLLRFTSPEVIGKRIRFFLNFGPYFGYLIKHVAETTGLDYLNNGVPNSITTDLTSHNKLFDYGIAFGAGMEIALTERVAITFEARFNKEFSDKTNDANSVSDSDPTQATNLLLGFTFRFGKDISLLQHRKHKY